MGANARRRHLERIMRRSGLAPKQPEIQIVKPPVTHRIKRSFKVVAVFGWIVVGLAWLVLR